MTCERCGGFIDMDGNDSTCECGGDGRTWAWVAFHDGGADGPIRALFAQALDGDGNEVPDECWQVDADTPQTAESLAAARMAFEAAYGPGETTWAEHGDETDMDW